MALSFLSLSSALAAIPSADYLVTVTSGRGVTIGAQMCIVLTETGGVLNFVNSGTLSTKGGPEGAVGNYYVFNSLFTGEINGIVFNGYLYHHGITHTSMTVYGDSGITGIGAFSAVAGGC